MASSGAESQSGENLTHLTPSMEVDEANPDRLVGLENVENTNLESEARRKFFRGLLASVNFLIVDQNKSVINDASVHFSDGIVKIPSLLLASICPVFRNAAAPMADISESPSVIIPDLSSIHFQSFLKSLLNLDDMEMAAEHEQDIQKVLDLLCLEFKFDDADLGEENLFLLDHDWEEASAVVTTQGKKSKDSENKENNEPKKRVGRKPGQKLNIKTEPYIKTEVMETHRESTFYGLRKSIKRKRFADEISEPSDLDLDEDDVEEEEGFESADEYEPDENEDFIDVEEEEEDSEDDSDFDELDQEEGDDEEEDDLEPDSFMMRDQEAEMIVTNDDDMTCLPTYTVHLDPDGNLDQMEVVEEEEEEGGGQQPKRGRPKKMKTEKNNLAKVVVVMEDQEEESGEMTFQGKVLTRDLLNQKRSLLKSSNNLTSSQTLFCSVCEGKFEGQDSLKVHVAQEHKGSKFFLLPKHNPHRDCLKCSLLLKSYETFVASADGEEKNVCFPCPHCRRRYLGNLGGLVNHLVTDHRNNVDKELDGNDKKEDYYEVLKRDEVKVLTCDFCSKVMPNSVALNKHLIGCARNDSGCSAGLFCHICGKMFAQARYLKDHLARHGKEQVNRPRNHCCKVCPVTCVTESNLAKHVEREHNARDPDEAFVLHEGCERCDAMLNSYMDNKANQTIPFREMVFKCPHCCMVLYANQKHAPRYLSNHIHKFHTDPEINDFTLGDKQPHDFRLRSKLEEDTLTCEFCGFASKTRANHNIHLSTCKQSTVPCRPGYMCDTCGFIAGTAVHLRNHLESHNDPKTYACDKCDYTGRSRRYLKSHNKNHHTREGQRKKAEANYVPCPKCGKLRKEGSSIKNHIKKCGSGPLRVSCPECEMEFKRREDMQAHALIHYGQVTCPIHNILFKQESEVFQHVNVAEPEEKFPRLQCCMCDSHFRHMCIFMKHMRRHLRIAPYRCNICQKHVNTYASLSLHMQRMHSGEKPPPKEKNFKCEQCGKVFSTRGHLKEHVAGVHDRSNTVNCPVCHKTFNTIKRMKKHLFNSHKDSADEFRNAIKMEPFSGLTIKI